MGSLIMSLSSTFQRLSTPSTMKSSCLSLQKNGHELSWFSSYLSNRSRTCEVNIALPLQKSPHVRESKTVLDSGLQVLDSSSWRWTLDSGFQSSAGFRIPKANFPGFPIPQPKVSQIPESGIRNPDCLHGVTSEIGIYTRYLGLFNNIHLLASG